VSGLVILAASVFEISCQTTDRQTHRQINTAENPTPATTVSVDMDNLDT